MDAKHEAADVELQEPEVEIINNDAVSKGGTDGSLTKKGTEQDAADMHRLGKRQQFNRNFHAFSVLGLTSTVMCTWVSALTASSFILIDGGRAGCIWMFLISWICILPVVASMAEMASMAPTSGGQYHWVSEFGPPSIQRGLSYIVGWLAALAWQAFLTSAAYPSGQLILIAASTNNPSYVPQLWQGTLMTMAVGLFAVLFNAYGAKRLPIFEGAILLFFFIGFFAVCIPLWVLAPMAPAREVFTDFSNFGGWSTIGVALIVGQIGTVGAFVGSDSAVHMAEEVRNASLNVPWMMLVTIFLNGTLGFVILLTYCFVIQDLEAQIVESTASFPFLEVFEVATGSTGGAVGMTIPIIILSISICVNATAAASRQAWSFARDHGLPFPHWFTKVTMIGGTPVPVNAIFASLFMNTIIALLSLGGSETFDSIYGVGESAACLTYAISISCVLWRRLFGAPLPAARFSLGKFGVACNSFAVLYELWVFVMSFFPLFRNVTAESMNWGIAMFGGVAILCIINYFVNGRKHYVGPVTLIRKEERGS